MNVLESLKAEIEPDCINDDELIYNIKDIILHGLDSVTQTVFLLYLEHNSMQKVGKILHVSATTIYYQIRAARTIIKEELQKRAN